jgi:HK97 gp10 family phage protein
MASHLKTNGKYRRALRALPKAAQSEVSRGLEDSVRTIQRFAVGFAPVWKGKLRRALASRGAIGKRKRGLEVEFGLRTKALQRKAFYAPFVEWGRKAYEVGGLRLRTVTREGLGKYRKMHRRVAAAPAQPFLRPAIQAGIPIWRRNMRAALKRAVRLAGG